MIAEMVKAKQPKNNKPIQKKRPSEGRMFWLGAGVGIGILYVGLWWFAGDRVWPGVRVAGMEAGGMRRREVEEKLGERAAGYDLRLEIGEGEVRLPSEVVVWQAVETTERAMRVGRDDLGEWWRQVNSLSEVEMQFAINSERMEKFLEELRVMTDIAAVPAEVELVKGGVMVTNGVDGVKLEEERLRRELTARLRKLDETPIRLVMKEERYALTEEAIEELKQKAGELVDDSLTLVVDEARAELGGEELVSFLSTNPASLGEAAEEKIISYLEGLSERYDREPQDAVLQFVEGKVEEFAPAKDGIEISKQDAVNSIQYGIAELMKEGVEEMIVEIPITRTPPKITTEEVNNLGIVERIGRGESYYAHSIPNRVYNVGLASKRVNGALVPPGEEFSFNRTVGEVSAGTGYKTAYIIANGRTELGDGGGVCQVSTTLFRAALNAGLTITERWAHAYRVGYYEQNAKPGFDATVYAPGKDLKFLNDTPGHILIQTTVDEPNRHLVFELYGTKDGRISLISPARVWGVSPPPPDLYQDDPTLPTGVVKQVDWAAWGAKAAFDYRVEREAETIFSKTFTSNFKPWQNVYLRGVTESFD